MQTSTEPVCSLVWLLGMSGWPAERTSLSFGLVGGTTSSSCDQRDLEAACLILSSNKEPSIAYGESLGLLKMWRYAAYRVWCFWVDLLNAVSGGALLKGLVG